MLEIDKAIHAEQKVNDNRRYNPILSHCLHDKRKEAKSDLGHTILQNKSPSATTHCDLEYSNC